MNETYEKQFKIYFGIDYSKEDGFTTECLMKLNDDGSLTLVDFNRWKYDIDLYVEAPIK